MIDDSATSHLQVDVHMELFPLLDLGFDCMAAFVPARHDLLGNRSGYMAQACIHMRKRYNLHIIITFPYWDDCHQPVAKVIRALGALYK